MVEPSERTLDLLDFGDGHLVGYGVALYDTDCISEELIPVLDGLILDVDGIFGTINQLILIDIDGVVLGIGEIDGIFTYIPNRLGYHLGAATGATHKK